MPDPTPAVAEDVVIDQTDYSTCPRPTTPPANLTKSVVIVDPSDPANTEIIPSSTTSPSLPLDVPSNMPPPYDEEPEIDALLMAQRARTPVAVIVSEDYSLVPFKVPYPLVTLGWFWVMDAWVSS